MFCKLFDRAASPT